MNEITSFLPSIWSETELTEQKQELPAQFCGINALVTAAMPLLLLYISLKKLSAIEQPDIVELRQNIINALFGFMDKAYKLNYSQTVITAANYCLCTALDERVLSTAWGHTSLWSHQTLLSTLQKETWGGERFFTILEALLKLPKENLHLLELLYIILSLGFEGKYYKENQNVRDEIRNNLLKTIVSCRGESSQNLSYNLKAIAQHEIPNRHFFTKRQLLYFALIIWFGLGIVFNLATYFDEHKVLQSFMEISNRLIIDKAT